MCVALGVAMSGRTDPGTVVFGETVAWRVSRSTMRSGHAALDARALNARGVWP